MSKNISVTQQNFATNNGINKNTIDMSLQFFK